MVQTVGDHHPAGQPIRYHNLHTMITGKQDWWFLSNDSRTSR